MWKWIKELAKAKKREEEKRNMDKPSAKIKPPSRPVTPRYTGEVVDVYLKSGQTVRLYCDDYAFLHDSETGEIVHVEFDGLKKSKDVYFVPSQIAGYTVRQGGNYERTR